MKIPKVIANSSLYSLSSFLQKGIGFLLMPLYTYFLTPDDYGILNVVTSITGFLGIIFMMSLHGAASRFHFNSDDPSYRSRVWGTILLLVLVNSVLLGVLSIVFHKYLIDPFTKNISFYPLVFIGILSTMLSPLYQFYQQWLRNRQEGWKYTLNSISNFLITVILNVTFLAVFHFGVLSLFVTMLFVAVIYFVYSLIRFLPHISFKYDKKIASDAMKYSLPLIPHNITGYWSVMIDRIMLNTIVGTTAVGLYSVGCQFGSIVSIIAYSINQAYSPWCYQEMAKGKDGDYGKLYEFADGSTVLCCLCALAISLFSPEVILFMTSSSSFHDAWLPIPFICFGYVANSLYYFFCQPLFFSHTKYVMIVSILALVTAYLGNLYLIPIFGVIGTGISLYASMMVTALLALILSLKFEPHIRYHFKRMIGLSLLMFAISLSVFLFQNIDSIFLRVCSKGLLLTVVMLSLILFYKEQVIIIKTRLLK